jgi:hypothetical protein
VEWSRVEQSGLNIIEQWESGRDQNSEELLTHSLTHSHSLTQNKEKEEKSSQNRLKLDPHFPSTKTIKIYIVMFLTSIIMSYSRPN